MKRAANRSPVVYLIDASPYIFRAYHALPSSIVDPEGRPVNAAYGFLGFLIRLVVEEAPTHLGVAFDKSLTTSFRTELFPEYKAKRESPPEELKAQVADCYELSVAFGAAAFIDERFEADDLLATVCASIHSRAGAVVIVSSDKDLAQLVDERVTLFDFARSERYDVEGVQRKLGVRPEQVPDLLGLAGDPVDNIPGVRGVGPKTAVQLLGEFESLEEALEGLDEIEAMPIRGARGLRTKLEEQSEMARLSKLLATVVAQAPVAADLAALEYRGAKRELMDPLLARLGGFGTVRERIPRWQ